MSVRVEPAGTFAAWLLERIRGVAPSQPLERT
jgi:hypothetical protein